MRAIVQDRFGPPEVLSVQDVDEPAPNDDQVLLEVRGASVNPYDWHMMRAKPHLVRLAGGGLFKPKNRILGVDVAGTVVAAGKNITLLQAGDEVFGGSTGSLAEYVCASERSLAPKPNNLSLEHAATLYMAGLTALQGLRKGRIEAGHRVLINGASGGVGTFAVQIAKAYGAEVTAVCSTRNVDMVRSIGADHVIDYTKENFTNLGRQYDVLFDIVSTQSLLACRRSLTPDGVYVSVGSVTMGDWISPLTHVLKVLLVSLVGRRKMVPFLAKMDRDDLIILKELVEAGKVTPVIDRHYDLAGVPDAIRYLEEGHVPGKVVIAVADSDKENS